MTEIIFITILILFIVAVAGAFVYFLYFPFRMLLLKSGKLKRKLDKQINITYLTLLCGLAIILFCFRDYRTSSQDRLEENAQIKLPEKFSVLKDEYEDGIQDYSISFHIRFSNKATKELIKQIRKSRNYNHDVNPEAILSDSLYFQEEKGQVIWCRSPRGYRFDKRAGPSFYSIHLDTINNVLKYNEYMI